MFKLDKGIEVINYKPEQVEELNQKLKQHGFVYMDDSMQINFGGAFCFYEIKEIIFTIEQFNKEFTDKIKRGEV